ncbi:MAG: hypothetical protein IKS41_03030 [Alphaproteobacteria bacterium]|nr:hypothetical protein [Alphaproteobacteria bacterium]
MKLRALNNGESGRSMVEMLGVLAIIGVLTVGGIFGYIYGMNKYRANEILDGATKRAYTVVTTLNAGKAINDADLSEFADFDEVPGGTFDSKAIDFTQQFALTIRGVEKPVCENLIRAVGKSTTLRAITMESEEPAVYQKDLKPGECNEGKNNLYLMYNLDMLGAAGDKVSSSASSSTGGGSVASSTGPTVDYDEWEKGSCENGYILVEAPYFGEPQQGCARTQAEAQDVCDTIYAAELAVGDGRIAVEYTNPGTGKKYFYCEH